MDSSTCVNLLKLPAYTNRENLKTFALPLLVREYRTDTRVVGNCSMPSIRTPDSTSRSDGEGCTRSRVATAICNNLQRISFFALVSLRTEKENDVEGQLIKQYL